MSPLEVRASVSLASLFGVRMLGLFLILPVFVVHAPELRGGDSATLVGLAIGIYGLMQALLQVPFGMASDRLGRKRVIVFGLVLFVIGSFIAASATDIYVVIAGRALQGAGAISAAVMALVADLTRDEHRTKAMAIVGASIGVVFALSLVSAPALYAWVGMAGIFVTTGLLGVAGIFVTWKIVPPEPIEHRSNDRKVRLAMLGDVLANGELLRLNFGIFVLHLTQVALFLVVPIALTEQAGLAVAAHWQVYLPVVLVSFVLMIPPIMAAERRGQLKLMFLGAVAAMWVVQIGFAVGPRSLLAISALLLIYFVAFNILEASLPSLVSKIAAVPVRGTAIGVFNTAQALGIAAGGVAGGWIKQHFGASAIFVCGIALIALWLMVALPMRPPAVKQAQLIQGDIPNGLG